MPHKFGINAPYHARWVSSVEHISRKALFKHVLIYTDLKKIGLRINGSKNRRMRKIFPAKNYKKLLFAIKSLRNRPIYNTSTR